MPSRRAVALQDTLLVYPTITAHLARQQAPSRPTEGAPRLAL